MTFEKKEDHIIWGAHGIQTRTRGRSTFDTKKSIWAFQANLRQGKAIPSWLNDLDKKMKWERGGEIKSMTQFHGEKN